MSKRLDKEREQNLQPIRMEKAKKEIEALGYVVEQVNATELRFQKDRLSGEYIRFFPYSGWHTGKGIKDGRGLNKLLNQLK